MARTLHKHEHVDWLKWGAGVGFAIAGALLLWILLSDWAKLIVR